MLHTMLQIATRLTAGRRMAGGVGYEVCPGRRVAFLNLCPAQALPFAIVHLVEISGLEQWAEVLLKQDLGGGAGALQGAAVTDGKLLIAQALPQGGNLQAALCAKGHIKLPLVESVMVPLRDAMAD